MRDVLSDLGMPSKSNGERCVICPDIFIVSITPYGKDVGPKGWLIAGGEHI